MHAVTPAIRKTEDYIKNCIQLMESNISEEEKFEKYQEYLSSFASISVQSVKARILEQHLLHLKNDENFKNSFNCKKELYFLSSIQKISYCVF